MGYCGGIVTRRRKTPPAYGVDGAPVISASRTFVAADEEDDDDGQAATPGGGAVERSDSSRSMRFAWIFCMTGGRVDSRGETDSGQGVGPPRMLVYCTYVSRQKNGHECSKTGISSLQKLGVSVLGSNKGIETFSKTTFFKTSPARLLASSGTLLHWYSKLICSELMRFFESL